MAFVRVSRLMAVVVMLVTMGVPVLFAFELIRMRRVVMVMRRIRILPVDFDEDATTRQRATHDGLGSNRHVLQAQLRRQGSEDLRIEAELNQQTEKHVPTDSTQRVDMQVTLHAFLRHSPCGPRAARSTTGLILLPPATIHQSHHGSGPDAASSRVRTDPPVVGGGAAEGAGSSSCAWADSLVVGRRRADGEGGVHARGLIRPRSRRCCFEFTRANRLAPPIVCG